MGWFNFRWEHPADKVLVAGSFTNWQPTVELEKTGTTFEKSVEIPQTSEKILYKFVVDGVWKHDHTGKTETDHEGNVNNVIEPSDIRSSGILGAMQSMNPFSSSVAPGASTAALAGRQPIEGTKEAMQHTPGAFPETPAAGLAEKTEDQTFGVNPIPASEGAGNPVKLAPGEKVPEPSTINANTLTSAVHDDPSLKSQQTEQTFGVAPIPASGGIGNPIHLQPGEKVPDSSAITGNTIGSNVKLDQASYEKSDSGAPQLPPVLTPQGEKEAAGVAAIFPGLGPQTTNMIPESSMGMGKDAPAPIDGAMDGAAISSVGANSTTNQLAGQVPLEPRGVPEVVSESQSQAHASPEASANPTAVSEKKEVEEELKSKVPQEKATTDTSTGDIIGAAAGGVAAVGAAAGAALGYNSYKSHNDSKGVPEVVSDSQKEAGVAPEASANPTAVEEKKDLENELKSKVPEEKATSGGGLTAGDITGAVAGGVAAVGAAAGAALGYNSYNSKASHSEAKGVPDVVAESQNKANAAPEASANPTAVEEKSEVENELKSKVPEEKPASGGGITGALPESVQKSVNENTSALAGGLADGLAVAGTAAAGAAIALNSKAKEATGTDAVSMLPTSVQQTIHENAKNSDIPSQYGSSTATTTAPFGSAASTTPAGTTASTVPVEVAESQKEAHVAPEASANSEAVAEKSAVEKELLKKVPESEATGTPAPTATAATSATAPTASTSTAKPGNSSLAATAAAAMTAPVVSTVGSGTATNAGSGAPQLADPVGGGLAPINMDKELNATASSQAQTPATKAGALAAQMDSRDVSPMSKPNPAGQTQPTVTTGIDSTTVPSQSKPIGTPRTGASTTTPTKRNSFMDRLKGQPEASKTPESEGKKKGFFGKLKEKLNKH